MGFTQHNREATGTGKRWVGSIQHELERRVELEGWIQTAPNPICCGDCGGRAGFLTKPYKIEEVQIL